MGKITEIRMSIEKQIQSTLAGKPAWMWWIGFSALCALLYLAFIILHKILTFKWWIPVLLILGLGIFWGTLAKKNDNPDNSETDTSES